MAGQEKKVAGAVERGLSTFKAAVASSDSGWAPKGAV